MSFLSFFDTLFNTLIKINSIGNVNLRLILFCFLLDQRRKFVGFKIYPVVEHACSENIASENRFYYFVIRKKKQKQNEIQLFLRFGRIGEIDVLEKLIQFRNKSKPMTYDRILFSFT